MHPTSPPHSISPFPISPSLRLTLVLFTASLAPAQTNALEPARPAANEPSPIQLGPFTITRGNTGQFLSGVFTQNNNIPSGEELSKGLDFDVAHTTLPSLAIMAAYAYTDAPMSKNLITTDGNSTNENRAGIADNVIYASYRDRRGYFVQSSTLQSSTETRF